ncbi:hypothetical protein OUZ56_008801 [Daphnia magna]|uniref:Kinesin motor domain-containing protein n=1 Tax=Daphnia magna TaxID=35525 RepID=A0ABR0AE40_9CRUS|nr:hypothetical protein OUZ56_008801 [Daphnia magna]
MVKVCDLLSKSRNEEVDIREDPKNGIKINGLTETPVSTWKETLKCPENGSLNRRTGATAMNHQSSRSHAIFTLTINQINKDSSSIVKTSKFHWLISRDLREPVKRMQLGRDSQKESTLIKDCYL